MPFSGTHVVSIKWALNRKPIWTDCIGLIRVKSGLSGNGLSGNGLEVEKLFGPHIISVTWVPRGKPMWVDSMGPVTDISGQGGNGVELGDIIWDPYCFSNMGLT